MTLRTAPTAPKSGWGQLVGHVLIRILLVALAYLASVAVALVAVVIIATLVSMVGAPDPFRGFGLPLFMALLIPTVGLFVYLLALIVAAGPALLAVIVAEGLALRQVWLNASLGAAVSTVTFIIEMPAMIGLAGQDLGDVAIMAGGGLVGGLVYWVIAGRSAGIVGQPTAGK